jgi:hypothetical protein
MKSENSKSTTGQPRTCVSQSSLPATRCSPSVGRPPIVFIYSARDSMWPGMGNFLFLQEGAIAAALKRSEQCIQKRLGWSLRAAPSAEARPPEHMQEAILTACQIALTAAWQERGVEPDAIVTRCGGEFAAAYAQGALVLEDAIEMACRVGTCIREGRGAGCILAVRSTIADVKRFQRASVLHFWVAGEEQLDLTMISCATDHASEIFDSRPRTASKIFRCLSRLRRTAPSLKNGWRRCAPLSNRRSGRADILFGCGAEPGRSSRDQSRAFLARRARAHANPTRPGLRLSMLTARS